MIKPRLKSPYLCLFFSLPFLAALGMDIYIWQSSGVGFHFSDTGYLVQHYLPDYYRHLAIAARRANDARAIDSIEAFLRVKTVVWTGLMAAVAIFLIQINRPRHREAPKSRIRVRR